MAKRMQWGALLMALGFTAVAAGRSGAEPLGLPPVPVPADNPQTPEKIALGDKLFHDAIEHIKTASKPNKQTSDADWAAGQKFTTAQAHNDLGMLAITQKKWDDGVKEFQLALDGDPDQDAYSARLALSYLNGGKPAEAIALCDKLLAKANLHPMIKSYVSNIKAQAVNASKK